MKHAKGSSAAIHAALKAKFASKAPRVPPPNVTPGKTPQLLAAIDALNQADDQPGVPEQDDPTMQRTMPFKSFPKGKF